MRLIVRRLLSPKALHHEGFKFPTTMAHLRDAAGSYQTPIGTSQRVRRLKLSGETATVRDSAGVGQETGAAAAAAQAWVEEGG